MILGVHLRTQPWIAASAAARALRAASPCTRDGAAAQSGGRYGPKISQQSGGPRLILFCSLQQNGGGIAVLRGRCFGKGKCPVHLRPAGLIPGRIQHCADMAIEQLTVQGGILAVHPRAVQ